LDNATEEVIVGICGGTNSDFSIEFGEETAFLLLDKKRQAKPTQIKYEPKLRGTHVSSLPIIKAIITRILYTIAFSKQ